ncbi:MAG: RecQ family ATP-dependent DNA helicase [Gammaproteobacteria bacterium]|nr:RecQ family ATP-dependent DNA helicase [Gammaproteobacteria bacterium]MYH85567.1 RecQ family ATP-dependent DNA helicase [Gammaproteobacteria bacterium]MYK04695.1 RecQ family ATP-dependent DNA helicase [Gammaproteobacteria bacterium]
MAETSATDKGSHPELPFKCLALDLEVTKGNPRVAAFAAVRSSDGESFHRKFGGKIKQSEWKQLNTFVDDSEVLIGHNLIRFDIPHLQAAVSLPRLEALPLIDTLWLNPLAFPKNPYHRLEKLYKDCSRGVFNDPEQDCRATLQLLGEQIVELRKLETDLLASFHWLTTGGAQANGFDALFTAVRNRTRPSETEAKTAIEARLKNNACSSNWSSMLDERKRDGWPLAFALSWLSVAGGNSVMPAWVRNEFPEAAEIIRHLRDRACGATDCRWCRDKHNSVKELKRWIGYPSYRPEPKTKSGKSMQQAIVDEIFNGGHALGILPTGTGKTLCYQIPALSRYDKTGALTVVISPLVALMADQVAGLKRLGIGIGIDSCVTVNGLLSMPERSKSLERVRLGDAAILIIAPEQLRNKSVRKALEPREIGLWVIDEAHCLSSWGHDFRPDYRYVSTYVKQKTEQENLPQASILCLTATAKKEVVREIQDHFRERLNIELELFDGGTKRDNLTFTVSPTTATEKLSHVFDFLRQGLNEKDGGGAIVYCATRAGAETIARNLSKYGLTARHFHAGLTPEIKKEVQTKFIEGNLKVIAATNAFGMGIDKPDVRMVIHADIPGSLENYLQEAGRAGRDQKDAHCVLLYTREDVEQQFKLSSRSRLSQREIQALLRALRSLDSKHRAGEVIATSGEILLEEESGDFQRDTHTDDTRVRTAISWLEDAKLLSRGVNEVNILPSSLRVSSIDEARKRIWRQIESTDKRESFLAIVERLLNADPDEGISTDELMYASGLEHDGIRQAFADLEKWGIATDETIMTAYVHKGVKDSSECRWKQSTNLEQTLVELMREMAPNMSETDWFPFHLRIASQRLRNEGHKGAPPIIIRRMLRGIAEDGRDEGGGKGSLELRGIDRDTVNVRLLRSWRALDDLSERRRTAAGVLLRHLLDQLPLGAQGKDLLAETSMGKLRQAMLADALLKANTTKPQKLLDRALLWLHEQEIVRLNKGLTVFRQAMTIEIGDNWKKSFTKAHFQPLSMHYRDRVIQIHVMAEFAQLGKSKIADAMRMAIDYFKLDQEEFLRRWLPNAKSDLSRQTTAESWRTIVERLGNPEQQAIVTSDGDELSNTLVLAGPGSGKTRVLVHRIAWLLRVKRENGRGIIALTYNRHAAVEIRQRLRELVGDDAREVSVMTCHGFAMQLIGRSFTDEADKTETRRGNSNDDAFKAILREAAGLLRGKDLAPGEMDIERQRLLAGFRWIFVDEYQDISEQEYELISALSGRGRLEQDDKLNLFAVGDDDQNIYSFRGASVEYIRRFERDYEAQPLWLVDNYRSSAHIIQAANLVIEKAGKRMKTGHPIQIDTARRGKPNGGIWERLDTVARGRVQVIAAADRFDQAKVALGELLRLSGLADSDWKWSRCAVIAKEWEFLDPVRTLCESRGVPVQLAKESFSGFWRLRETQNLLSWLRRMESGLTDAFTLLSWLEEQTPGYWIELLQEAVESYKEEAGEGKFPIAHFIEWLAEWGRQAKRRQYGLLLVTAHSAKGLQFDHVVILDGGWDKRDRGEDPDSPRRLYYVAMTRARQTLTLMRFPKVRHPFVDGLVRHSCAIVRAAPAFEETAAMTGEAERAAAESAAVYRIDPNAREHLKLADLRLCYKHLDLKDIDLGYVGSYTSDHAKHEAIAGLSKGDSLKLASRGEKQWLLLDQSNHPVGQLARDYDPPAKMRVDHASVLAIIRWSRKDSEPKFHDRIRCDREWEVVIPELVFLPDD